MANGPGTNEFIQVADFSGTVLPGRWYLAVVNASGAPSFSVCAKEIPGPIVPLTVNLPEPVLVSTGAVQYFRVTISSNAYQADFQTLLASGNVDLYISTNTMTPLLVTPTNAMFASTVRSSSSRQRS